MAWCSTCGDEFAPVEYRPPSVEGPNFCSDPCEEKFPAIVESDRAYAEGRYGAAPMWP